MVQKEEINRIILAIAQRNEASAVAVDELYEKMSGMMYSVAYAVLLNSFSAEDAVMDSFIKIVNNADKFRRADNGYGWTLAITRNTALNKLKAEKSHSTSTLEGFDAPDLNQTDNEDKIAVENALSHLDEKERQIISLKYYEDKTVRQIAVIMRMPFSTVQNVINKAEKTLRKYLTDGTNN